MIQLFRVSKYFGAIGALKEVSVRVCKGEFVFLTGPSGAGKTTLLRLMFGAEQPTEGRILINGINLSRVGRSKLDFLRRRIGFVFQDFKLLHRKTVLQNVALASEVTGEKWKTTRRETHQLLRALGLTAKEQAYPLELSGGEQQRVAIARAMINDPILIWRTAESAGPTLS
jgi:cell division transport system ATP-binding protein